MDILYEESAVNQNGAKESKKYSVLHVISIGALGLGLVFLLWAITSIPLSATSSEALATQRALCIILFLQTIIFLAIWFVLSKWKARLNVSYDYLFISGELRISKVVGGRRHKPVATIDCEDIQKIGDVDNSSYSRLKDDPNTKVVICTGNSVPAEGKFFMYVLASHAGKKLFVLECREMLLMNMLKFLRHGILEDDYVMQYKK